MTTSGAGHDEWCLIESDPGVFTELIRGFGATGVQVEELYSLEPECFENLKPVHGLIFLFKWVADDFSDGSRLTDKAILDELFYAKQVIHNACATQALISILMNCHHGDLKLGQTLADFKEFTRSFDAHLKGLSLSNADQIRAVHNSFARQQVFEFEGKSKKKEKEDAFHFISYIPFAGRLIELDGLKEGPYDLGPIAEGDDWVATARPHIEKRMQKYATGEIHFNLMALVSDQKMVLSRRLAELTAAKPAEQGAPSEDVQLQVEHLKMLIGDEEAKMERYKAENIRRKHNYLPLIVDILSMLAEQGKLVEQYEKAKSKSIQQLKLKKKKKPSGESSS